MRSDVREEAVSRSRGTIIVVVLLVNLVINLLLAVVLLQQNAPPAEGQRHPAPECTVIPIKLILEDPECADKLLRAMNVTNVRILPKDQLLAASGVSNTSLSPQ